MKHEILHLKDFFPALGENGCDAALTTYLPDNLTEMGRDSVRRPCLVICPGGGYQGCSQREAEPAAFNFLSDGFNVFVLNYSVAPHRYPTQLREAAAAMELIYQNAEAWHCNTTQIAIMGFSAGGHLAANQIPFELHVYPFGDHGLATCDIQTIDNPTAIHAYDHAWLPAAKKWLHIIFSSTRS